VETWIVSTSKNTENVSRL